MYQSPSFFAIYEAARQLKEASQLHYEDQTNASKIKHSVMFYCVVLIRLQAMKREVHLRELQLLDAVRRRFMHHQQTLKEAELQRLDDDIERKVRLHRPPSKS